jgi:hypothetical protein
MSLTFKTLTITEPPPAKSSFYQPKHKAGLPVTSEWTNARDECKEPESSGAIWACVALRLSLQIHIENYRGSCLYGLTPKEVCTPTDVRRGRRLPKCSIICWRCGRQYPARHAAGFSLPQLIEQLCAAVSDSRSWLTVGYLIVLPTSVMGNSEFMASYSSETWPRSCHR